MAFSAVNGFPKTPGMQYEIYRFNITSTNETSYFIVSNYTGNDITNSQLLSDIRNAILAVSGVSSVDVIEYNEVNTDITSTL